MIEQKIECKINEAKLNWKNALNPNDIKISGHVFKTTEVHDNVTVFVSECEHCGETSLSWSKPGAMTESLKRMEGFPYNEELADVYTPVGKDL